MIVAPSEPRRLLDAAAHVSNLPEESGGDVLIIAHPSRGHIIIQRKEIKDLLASLSDGRLSEQVQKLRGAELGILLIEGRPKWSSDGTLLTDYGNIRLTWQSFIGILWSIRDEGIWVDFTDSLAQTVEYLQHLESWAKKEKHTSLHASRPGPTKRWGKVGNRDWERWVLMSLPGVGGEIADRVLDMYGMPLRWGIGRDELMKVEGLGKVKIEKMLAAVPMAEGVA